MPFARARMLGQWLMVLGLAAIFTPSAGAAERYFVAIFGSQTFPKVPKYTHTWLAMVRIVEDPAGCRKSSEITLVSWMPQTLRIRAFAFQAEPGANLDMAASLRDAIEKHETISMWGPFEVNPEYAQELYEKVCRQADALACGQVRYRCMVTDATSHSRPISNCIHAVTDLVPEPSRGYLSKIRRFGNEASEFAVHQFANQGWIDPRQRVEWVIDLLGLEDAPVNARVYKRHWKWGRESYSDFCQTLTSKSMVSYPNGVPTGKQLPSCSSFAFSPITGSLRLVNYTEIQGAEKQMPVCSTVEFSATTGSLRIVTFK